MGISISVGKKEGNIVGSDNRALQAAVDYVAALGGGRVQLGAGEFLMYDSLHLRSNVKIIGKGEDTVLRKCDGFKSNLLLDGDFAEECITIENPSGLKVGMGVTIKDDNTPSNHITVATIISSEGNRFTLNKPIDNDCRVTLNATAENIFPIISGYNLDNVEIENIIIYGNKENGNGYLNGCRGGGIYLSKVNNVKIKKCQIYNYNGDGISYQRSDDVVVEKCICKNNSYHGLHPGSGSQRTIIRDNICSNNGKAGLFICWRVKNSVIENNHLIYNKAMGISIGHKDTDNIFKDNKISENGQYGVFFRREIEAMGAHRNLFENNCIENNGEKGNGVGIFISGYTRDIKIINNIIRDTRENGQKKQRYGIFLNNTENISIEKNDIYGNISASVKKEEDITL